MSDYDIYEIQYNEGNPITCDVCHKKLKSRKDRFGRCGWFFGEKEGHKVTHAMWG